MRHLPALVLAGATALGVCLLAAPTAAAATTSNCANGLGNAQYGVISPVVALGSSCTGFVDTGSPYVFHIATFNVLQTLPNPIVYRFYNVTATCGSIGYYNGSNLRGQNCTYANL